MSEAVSAQIVKEGSDTSKIQAVAAAEAKWEHALLEQKEEYEKKIANLDL